MDGERYLIPDCAVISRKTGKVERIEYREGDAEDLKRMGRVLLQLARMGRKMMEEESA